jgi:hypothetical protein
MEGCLNLPGNYTFGRTTSNRTYVNSALNSAYDGGCPEMPVRIVRNDDSECIVPLPYFLKHPQGWNRFSEAEHDD